MRVTLENRSAVFEAKFKRSDNSVLDVEINSLAMDNRRKTILITARDITLRKESERLIQKEREILSALLEKSLCGILLIEASSHKIVDVNPVAIKAIGKSKQEIVGNICHKFICPTEIGKCPISDLGLTVDNSEKKMINARKEIIPILKSVVPVTIEGKDYFVECFIDLSESKRTEQKLLQAKLDAEAASRAKSEFHFEIFSLSKGRNCGFNLIENRANRKLTVVKFHFTGFYLRKVKDIVYKPKEMFSADRNVTYIFQLFFIKIPKKSFIQDIRKTNNGVAA